jgi:propionate CoA-transferase
MNSLDKIKLINHILRWRLAWSKHDLDYKPEKIHSSSFLSAREAARLIKDGDCVFSSGIAGNARCSIFYYALRDRFLKTKHPQGLTWINGGAQGSRGRVPGTIEEIGLPGLMDLYLTAHLETCKAQLKLGQEGKLELHTLPQGIISRLLENQAKGREGLWSSIGVGSFLDPSRGRGSIVNPPGKRSFVSGGKDRLKYNMPTPNVALFSVPYADEEGNLYFKNTATITENIQSIKAVRKNKGLVMAAVSGIILKSEDEISVPARYVDHIVVNPWNEQTISVPQGRFWDMFTPDFKGDARKAMEKLKFINNFLKITPVRDSVGRMMARLGASVVVKNAEAGSMINIGTGYPEEVARVLLENKLEEEFIFTTEAGSYGGLPAPGIFFGAAIKPRHLEPSSTMFRRYQKELDVAVLGFLEVDEQGNVNVSKRGANITDYVGPGGFLDLVDSARTILFIGNWMHAARYLQENDQIRLMKAGQPKFLKRVREITFNGRIGAMKGQRVFYVTEVGLFRLRPEGIELQAIFPGIDIESDILSHTDAKLLIPPYREIEVIGRDILSGERFSLKLPKKEELQGTTSSVLPPGRG